MIGGSITLKNTSGSNVAYDLKYLLKKKIT